MCVVKSNLPEDKQERRIGVEEEEEEEEETWWRENWDFWRRRARMMTVPETAMAVAKTAPCEVIIEDIVWRKEERFGLWWKLRKVRKWYSLMLEAANKGENIYIIVQIKCVCDILLFYYIFIR